MSAHDIILLLLSRSVVFDSFVTPCTAACQTSLSFTISRSWLKLISVESLMPSSHLILCHPLLLLTSIFSSIRVFSSESAVLIRWRKYWSFSISPSGENSGLISFRIDCFDWLSLAVHGTLKSLLQQHSSKKSILWLLAFFMVQLWHPYMTTGKTIALTILYGYIWYHHTHTHTILRTHWKLFELINKFSKVPYQNSASFFVAKLTDWFYSLCNPTRDLE